MDKLIAELTRLYFLPQQNLLPSAPQAHPERLAHVLQGHAPLALGLVDDQGRVRTLALRVLRPEHWPAVAALCQGLNDDWQLPQPAVSLYGGTGFQVWFSLAQAVPLADGLAFLHGLQQRYWADLPPHQHSASPDAHSQELPLCPCRLNDQDQWAAFIDPTLGSMFSDSPCLDMPPSLDKQADLLATVRSISPSDFQRILSQLQNPTTTSPHYHDPKSFLLSVMNDPATPMPLRIEAAKVLLLAKA